MYRTPLRACAETEVRVTRSRRLAGRRGRSLASTSAAWEAPHRRVQALGGKAFAGTAAATAGRPRLRLLAYWARISVCGGSAGNGPVSGRVRARTGSRPWRPRAASRAAGDNRSANRRGPGSSAPPRRYQGPLCQPPRGRACRGRTWPTTCSRPWREDASPGAARSSASSRLASRGSTLTGRRSSRHR
jgi:hypothetical protein